MCFENKNFIKKLGKLSMVPLSFCTLLMVPLSFFYYQWYSRTIERLTTVTFLNIFRPKLLTFFFFFYFSIQNIKES